ncbi:hypothetical protein F2P56_009734, partial [Juglans regia]
FLLKRPLSLSLSLSLILTHCSFAEAPCQIRTRHRACLWPRIPDLFQVFGFGWFPGKNRRKWMKRYRKWLLFLKDYSCDFVFFFLISREPNGENQRDIGGQNKV